MRTLVPKHKINQIPVSWTLLLSLLTLPTAWLSLIALGPHQSALCLESGIVGGEVIPQHALAKRASCGASQPMDAEFVKTRTRYFENVAYTDLAFATI